MAGGSSNYTRGEMKVDAQAGTFSGFMGGTIYGGALVALVVIMPTLVFALGMGWPTALLITLILGFVIGAVLKLKAAWYAALVGLAIVVAIFCFLIGLMA
jgi:hypothetical protein